MQLRFVGPKRETQLCSPCTKFEVAEKALILDENLEQILLFSVKVTIGIHKQNSNRSKGRRRFASAVPLPKRGTFARPRLGRTRPPSGALRGGVCCNLGYTQYTRHKDYYKSCISISYYYK